MAIRYKFISILLMSASSLFAAQQKPATFKHNQQSFNFPEHERPKKKQRIAEPPVRPEKEKIKPEADFVLEAFQSITKGPQLDEDQLITMINWIPEPIIRKINKEFLMAGPFNTIIYRNIDPLKWQTFAFAKHYRTANGIKLKTAYCFPAEFENHLQMLRPKDIAYVIYFHYLPQLPDDRHFYQTQHYVRANKKIHDALPKPIRENLDFELNRRKLLGKNYAGYMSDRKKTANLSLQGLSYPSICAVS